MPSTPEVSKRIRAHNRLCQLQNVMDQAVQGWDFRFHHPADFQQQPTVTESRVESVAMAAVKVFAGLFVLTLVSVLISAIAKSVGV